MSTFTALNIEPDDHNEVEVDNTKEILVEEALKIYQTALKLHAQGPKYYEEAAEAYDALFKSELFKYPESLTEFTRLDKHPELAPFASYNGDAELAVSGDGGNSLPEIFYLAYKNHGQFILDCLRHRQQTTAGDLELRHDSKFALEEFSQAIARDESDADLWRKAARIGGLLGSQRIARFCLEAAVEVDDDPTLAEVELPALEEAFAGEQLKDVLRSLDDDTALEHPIMRPFTSKSMNPLLKKRMELFTFLPKVAPKPGKLDSEESRRLIIDVPERSWASLTDALFLKYSSHENASATVSFKLPTTEEEDLPSPSDDLATIEQQLNATLTEAAKEASPNRTEPAKDTVDSQSQSQPQDNTEAPCQREESAEHSQTHATRKRSQSIAGIHESPVEENTTQKRSKRIRNRETIHEPIVDPAVQLAEQLQEFVDADTIMFDYAHSLLAKIDVQCLGTLSDVKAAMASKSGDGEMMTSLAATDLAIRDLQTVLHSWDDAKASTMLTGSGSEVLGAGTGPNALLSTFLEHAKAGPQKPSVKPTLQAADDLLPFVQDLEQEWICLRDVVFSWLRVVYPTYTTHFWPEPLKHAVVRLISLVDAEIYEYVLDEIAHVAAREHSHLDFAGIQELVQMLLELHLDVFTKITNPNSVVDVPTRIKTKDKLDRWALLAADLMRDRNGNTYDEICLRYIWTSALYATMTDGASREHIVLIWTELEQLLKEVGNPTVELQNNAVVPEISAAAAEREISRLTTMDFFLSLFQPDDTDPTTVIETLEPVLDPDTALPPNERVTHDESGDTQGPVPATLQEMWKFLQNGSTSLRLFLWQRLREAYETVDYQTKVFSCLLKSIEIIAAEFCSPSYAERQDEPRVQSTLLTWLKLLHELLTNSLTLAINEPTAFEIIDEDHIKSSCIALAQISRILHSAALFEDEARVGLVHLPRTTSYTQGSFAMFQGKLREMQVRTWSLLYAMLKEATIQCKEHFPAADSDLADYLANVHQSLGLRKYCKTANKVFLKMMKKELLRLRHVEKIEIYLGQVLFDLNGLRFGSAVCEPEDHGCPTEVLTKRATTDMSDIIIVWAKRLSMKDLLKSDMRSALERMQQAIGNPKPTPQMTHNQRNIAEYVKSSLNADRLAKAVKGLLSVDFVPVTTMESPLAQNGWFFLMGHMALAKFKSQKRLGPGATDDLKVAATFLRLQLQFQSEHWESWYRLAQCHDAELEEDVLWSADKINSNHADLVRQQRSAIHCYAMAISTALRTADYSFETASKISEMYYDFGMRLYSSSREPFAMKAFMMEDFERVFSGAEGMYKKHVHEGMPVYYVWALAANVFKKAMTERPEFWLIQYMYGKCLWKLFSRATELEIPAHMVPTRTAVLDALVRTIEIVPKPKDNRSDPILEPHFKLRSIVHKLVIAGALPAQDGANLLQRQPLAWRKGETIIINSPEDWEPFILESIRYLRNIDKSNWHHRMISRVAHILFDEEKPDFMQASAARHELRDSLFTKTMVVQVWKPEYERAGRHCVYMQRYVRFIINILQLLNDKTNMEMLVKRVRKKQPDYFGFGQVWAECCTVHCRLIRRAYDIPHSHDETFKAIPAEEFEVVSDRLNTWVDSPDSSHPALDCLREAMELKKLNQNLMKATLIDDLISDAWSILYLEIGVSLIQREKAEESRAAEEPQPPARTQGPMSLNSLMNADSGPASASEPAQSNLPTQTTTPASASEAPARRPKTIGRREILRRAEAAINRHAEPSKPTGKGTGPGRGRRKKGAVQEEPEENDEEEEADGAKADNESSAPGSVHDSADDESDLSDVPDMDDVDAATIFPNESKDGDADTGADQAETPDKGDALEPPPDKGDGDAVMKESE